MLGWRISGAALQKNTFLAPASRAMDTSCIEVVPRTMESSTRSTFLPSNSALTVLSLRRTFFLRCDCSGMMKVRPIYLFLMNPSRYGLPSFCASASAEVRLVSGMGITTSISSTSCSRLIFSASFSPMRSRDSYTDTPFMMVSGLAKYTYSKRHGTTVLPSPTSCLDMSPRSSRGWLGFMGTASTHSPGLISRIISKPRVSEATDSELKT
mmetsp:Transcript_18716/g.36681  ORF Transcript_18716/g.36681 Transcript_18716/m.36681 type:complete len:210 (-) Transcript_18716:1109-1738(-)